MPNVQPNRTIPVHADAFAHRLPNFARQLAGSDPVKIVAIGSSSTAGEGNIVPYPSRLQAHLTDKYPQRNISVINRGIGGEEAPAELARMKTDVINAGPALVIWQVGTNAVWQPGYDLDAVAAAIAAGLQLLAAEPADVVLMDLQYAPAVLTDDTIEATRRMLMLIGEAAAATPGVNLFRRFAMMQKWHEIEKFSFDTLIDMTDPTRLHQSDYSARRIGYEVGETIAEAAGRACA